MAISFRHLIPGVIALWALFAGDALRAQVPAKPAPEVSLRFTVFALGGADDIVYRPKTGAAPAALRFYSAYRSPEYAYRGEARLEFYDAKADPAAGPIAVYMVPENPGLRLLLFFPRQTSVADGLKYDVYGVEDGDTKTPPGYFTTINVSGREYVGQYGTTRIRIPQGVGEAHAGKPRISLKLAAQIEGDWMSSGKHEFSMSAQDRVILVFYPPESRTGIYPIIRRLTDTVPPPKIDKGTGPDANPVSLASVRGVSPVALDE